MRLPGAIKRLIPAGLLCLCALPATAADMVISGGPIWAAGSPEAVAVTDGYISAVGDYRDMPVTSTTEIIDLEGAFLLPGFIDNHIHVGEGGEVTCFPENHLPLERQARLLTECKRGVPKGDWIIGYGTHLYIVLDEERGRPFNRPIEVLDEVFPDHPVIIKEHTSHAMYVNTRALAVAGLRPGDPDPVGGVLMHDERGAFNGVLIDNAGDLVMEIAVNSLAERDDILYQGILDGLAEVRRHGLTTLGDGRSYWRRGVMEAWEAVEAAGELTARVSLRPWIYPTLSIEAHRAFLRRALRTDLEADLIVNQVKLYIDGTIENGTARVSQPYEYSIFPGLPYGLNYIDAERMVRWLKALDEMGYGAHIHAIGDLGVNETLDAIAAARAAGSKQIYNMTHLAYMRRSDLPRFRALDVDADLQIATAYHSHAAQAEDFGIWVGYDRALALALRPVKQLYKARANVVLSSDWTVNPVSPLSAIGYAVEERAMSVDQALTAYTMNAAQALGLDALIGTIEVGKSADFAVLAEDLRRLSGPEIRGVETLMTVYRGEIVYP